MRVYGPFHALNNPIVAIALGLRGAEDALQVYDRYKEAHQNDFLTKALLTGQPVTELPGGPFRQIASKLTGGFIHPNIEASSRDILEETLALRKQEGENIKEAGELSNIRKNVGPTPFMAGGPYARLAQHLGIGDLTQPTPGEQKEAQAEQYKQTQLERGTPEYKGSVAGAEAAARLGVSTSPAALSALGLRTKITKEAGLEVETSPAATAAAAAKSFATHEAGVAGTAAGVENLNLGQYRARSGGKAFINRNTLAPAPPSMKVKDAYSNPDLAPIGIGKDEQGAAEARGMLKQLAQADRLVDKIFPAMPRSAGISGDVILTKAGLSHWNNRRTDPDVQRMYQLKGFLIQYIKNQQGRYASGIELTNIGPELVPEPGGISPYGKPIRSDSNEVAHQKIFQLQQRIRDTYLAAAVESSSESSDDSHDKDIDSVYAPD